MCVCMCICKFVCIRVNFCWHHPTTTVGTRVHVHMYVVPNNNNNNSSFPLGPTMYMCTMYVPGAREGREGREGMTGSC